MGKEAGAAAPSSTVVLAVNGKRYEAAGMAPSMSLLEFLRTQTPVRGPKLGFFSLMADAWALALSFVVHFIHWSGIPIGYIASIFMCTTSYFLCLGCHHLTDRTSQEAKANLSIEIERHNLPWLLLFHQPLCLDASVDLFAASGEPPLLLASSVHCAMREAIRAARKEFSVSTGPANSTVTFQMDVPATMPIVKELCGLDIVERYLESVSAASAGPNSTKA